MKIRFAFLLFLGCLLALPVRNDACECAVTFAAINKQYKNKYPYIFSAIVIRTILVDDERGDQWVEMKIERIYRGHLPETVQIYTGPSTGGCFTKVGGVGTEYLLAAYPPSLSWQTGLKARVPLDETKPFLLTDMCAGFVPMSDGDGVPYILKKLGRGRKPRKRNN